MHNCTVTEQGREGQHIIINVKIIILRLIYSSTLVLYQWLCISKEAPHVFQLIFWSRAPLFKFPYLWSSFQYVKFPCSRSLILFWLGDRIMTRSHLLRCSGHWSLKAKRLTVTELSHGICFLIISNLTEPIICCF